MKLGQLQCVLYHLLVVHPGHKGYLDGRHEDIDLHPTDVQLPGGQALPVPVAAHHVRQHKRVADKPKLKKSGDHAFQPIVKSPGGKLVKHSNPDWKMLTVAPGSHLNHGAKEGTGLHIRGGEHSRPFTFWVIGAEDIVRRHPV